MKNLKRHIKSREDFKKFTDILILKVRKEESISSSPMLDGLIIGFIISTYKLTEDLLLDKNMGYVLDASMQRLEQIAIWFSNNEKQLVELVKNEKKLHKI